MTKALGQALAVATLVAAITGLFIPIKHYVDREEELERTVISLQEELKKTDAEIITRVSVLETKVELMRK